MSNPDHYIPGVCNIGPAEIKARMMSGWVGVAATVVVGGALFGFDAAPSWRLILFFPATIAATGFIQGLGHFCLGFGFKALFNFGELGTTDSVEQAEFRRMDRHKAWTILLTSIAIGLAVALTAFFS
jgi:hypothetical protein